MACCKAGLAPVDYRKHIDTKLLQNDVFLSLKIVFISVHSAHPDEMPL